MLKLSKFSARFYEERIMSDNQVKIQQAKYTFIQNPRCPSVVGKVEKLLINFRKLADNEPQPNYDDEAKQLDVLLLTLFPRQTLIKLKQLLPEK